MATRLKPAEASSVIYLYGVTSKPVAVPSLNGVDGLAIVEPMECAGLTCWVSYVPRREFADNLASNMENLEWLSETGVRHQSVVASIAKVTDILPARFGAVFLDVSSLKADIRKRKMILSKDLRRVRGCDEWGIKVFAVQPEVNMSRAKPATGRDYLTTKAALIRRPKAALKSEELADFHKALRRISVATDDRAKISAGQRGLQWQASFLLKHAERTKLEAILNKYSDLWADSGKIECTGPWPPYSFVTRTENGGHRK